MTPVTGAWCAAVALVDRTARAEGLAVVRVRHQRTTLRAAYVRVAVLLLIGVAIDAIPFLSMDGG
jgi:hypothetical protein